MGKVPFLKIGAKLLVQQADREDRALASANAADRRRELETGLYRPNELFDGRDSVVTQRVAFMAIFEGKMV